MEIKKEQVYTETSPARDMITALFDDGTFLEVGAYVKRARSEFGENMSLEGVITGYGAIDGRLVFAFAEDFTRFKGAIGSAHAAKINRLYEMAMKAGAPVVGIFDGAGADITEGVGALAGYGSIMKNVTAAWGVIPQIAVIAGSCAGGSAVIVQMFDLVIGAADKGKLYVNSPFLLKDNSIGSIKSAAELGQISLVTTDPMEACTALRRVINYLPQNNTEGTVYALNEEDANRLIPEADGILAASDYDMGALIEALADDQSFLSLSDAFAPEMLTGFAQIGGMIIGVVANQPKLKQGAITPDGARKAAHFISFCDSFNIPLLTIADTCGYAVDNAMEASPYAAALAKLASAYAAATCPTVTLIAGRAYGSAFALMGSKSLGADVVFALERAEITALSPEASVDFVWSGKKGERTALIEEWKRDMASPLLAASVGEIDDIIAVDEIRVRVAAAFEMLTFKADAKAAKKHGVIPL